MPDTNLILHICQIHLHLLGTLNDIPTLQIGKLRGQVQWHMLVILALKAGVESQPGIHTDNEILTQERGKMKKSNLRDTHKFTQQLTTWAPEAMQNPCISVSFLIQLLFDVHETQPVSSNLVFLAWRMSPSLSTIILLLPDSQVQTSSKFRPAHHKAPHRYDPLFLPVQSDPGHLLAVLLHSLPDGPLYEHSPVSSPFVPLK